MCGVLSTVVSVSGCENLQSLFPVALAKTLKKLDKLEAEDCHGLLEIVGKEEDTIADQTEKFVFPCLTWLHLCDLPQLTYFYPGPFILECLSLNKLSVLGCLNLNLFENGQPEDEGSSATSFNTQSLFSNVKAVSNFEELSLHWKHISVLRSRVGQLTEDLKDLNVVNLFFDVDVNEKPILPIEILEKAPNLQGMIIGLCNSLELFLAQNPNIGEHGMLGRLKTLTLMKVSIIKAGVHWVRGFSMVKHNL